MRIDIDAAVVDRGGADAGRVGGLVFERASRRLAGFLVRIDGAVPREVLVAAAGAARIEPARIALALAAGELADLPDARQRLYVEAGQDMEAEVAAAEAETGPPDTPDPEERPAPSAIPGIAFLPNMMIPIEVERSALGAGQVALEEGLRVIAADGEDLGQANAAILDEELQLIGLLVGDEDQLVVGYDWLDQLDENANEVTLTVTRAELAT